MNIVLKTVIIQIVSWLSFNILLKIIKQNNHAKYGWKVYLIDTNKFFLRNKTQITRYCKNPKVLRLSPF